MEVLRSASLTQDMMITHRMRGRRTGLVPTMGALHEGHLQLIKQSVQDNDVTVVSIFVNPTQFGPGEDLEKYPRPIGDDLDLCKSAGVNVVFMPDASTMYGADFSTHVEPGEIGGRLCGAFRPAHFRGVCTVVTKLLSIALPVRAYFGQKDYQQVRIIMNLVRDLNLPTEVVMCQTIREEDGLALSSRNRYLSKEQRAAAPVIYRALSAAVAGLKNGDMTPQSAGQFMLKTLGEERLITDVQYAGIYDAQTLIELQEYRGSAVAAVAVKMGDTRLIDNMLA